MDSDNDFSNRSGNRPFDTILTTRLSRRQILIGGAATAATAFLGNATSALAHGGRRWRKPLINFTPVPLASAVGPVPSISADYELDILIPWGEPLEAGGPASSYPPNAADQALQIGIGHDGMWFFPLEDRKLHDGDFDDRGRFRGRHFHGNSRGMLVVNHEFGTNQHVLGKLLPTSLEDVRVSQHAHGVAVVEIARMAGRWRPVRSHRARRIHGNTPMAFSGPAAGHPLLQTLNGNVLLGTLNNCASGDTPWGTYLSCEENFNGYFGASDLSQAWVPTAAQQRYAFSGAGFGYGWHLFDKRFDLSDPEYANEENRFGWVVEIDPMDATQTPVKRTALGRFKHENATVVVGRGGRVVVYMGDDERFDYIYKFVSDDH